MAKPALVIIGGGFAGFWAAVAARRVAGDELDITVVSAGPVLQMRPRLYEANPAAMGVDLAPLLATIDATLIIDTAQELDLANKRVILNSRPALAYDRLVVATGSTMRRPDFEGVEQALSIDTVDEAVVFDDRLAALASRSESENARTPRTPATVAVIGAGFTGIELALELRDRLNVHSDASGEAMRIVLIDRNATVGAELGPNPNAVIVAALTEARVETMLGATITAVTETEVNFSDGSRLDADAVVLTTGLCAASFADRIPGDRDGLGRIIVDRTLRAPNATEIFVTGDAAAVDTGSGHLTLQSCQHAMQLGRVAGENAARDLRGEEPVSYTQTRYVTCLDLGRSGAVLTKGWDRVVVGHGADTKAIKRHINSELIYPPTDADRETLLSASVVTIT